MSDIPYGKRYITKNFYDMQETSEKIEDEISLFTTQENVLKDYIEAFKVISTKQTHKLNVEVCIDAKGRYRIVKKWSVDDV